jgi:hypothetical protein
MRADPKKRKPEESKENLPQKRFGGTSSQDRKEETVPTLIDLLPERQEEATFRCSIETLLRERKVTFTQTLNPAKSIIFGKELRNATNLVELELTSDNSNSLD